MVKFLKNFHREGTLVQVGTLREVGSIGAITLQEFCEKNVDNCIFFLGGVNPDRGDERARNEDVTMKNNFVIDIDLRSKYPDMTDDEIVEDAGWLKNELDNSVLFRDWSYIVFTGNGLHIHYIGDWVTTEDYPDGVGELYRIFEQEFGLPVDFACKNTARILRLPGTFNNKRGEHKLVRVLYEQERKTSLLESLPIFAMDARLAAQEKIEAKKSAPLGDRVVTGDNPLVDEINRIDMGELVARHFGFEHRNGKFYEPGDPDRKGFYIGNGGVLYPGGSHHIPDDYAAYTPYLFIKTMHSFDAKQTFDWFRDHYPEIDRFAADQDEKFLERKALPVVHQSVSPNSYTWGLDYIDEHIQTLKKGQFCVLASEENQGKSTFCYFMARENKKRYGHTVVYFNLEQTREEMIHGIARQFAGIDKRQLRDNEHETNDAYLLKKKQLEDDDSMIFIGSDEPLLNAKKICEIVKSQPKVDLLIVDNLSVIENIDSDVNEGQKGIVMQFLRLARDANIPVILVHHYKKKQGKAKALFRDVAEISGSGIIKNVAHMIVQVARLPEADSEREKAEFYIREGKVRDGGTREEVMIYHDRGDFSSLYKGDIPPIR